MDSFEAVVKMLLEKEGFWVRSSFKVELTKEEKRAISRPSSPRWELDLVAYKGKGNELRVVECKSYLDSAGVKFGGFDGTDRGQSTRYKLFVEPILRKTVIGRLVKQLKASGAVAPNPKVVLCLAAGKVAGENERAKVKAHFKKKKWLFLDEVWLKKKLKSISSIGYEDEVATIVTKLLLRKEKEGK